MRTSQRKLVGRGAFTQEMQELDGASRYFDIM
jgi:hypothetical protein